MKEILGLAFTLLFSVTCLGQGFETLRSGQTTVEFERTGDDLQIRRFRQKALPQINRILKELSEELGGDLPGSDVKIHFYSPVTFANRFPHTVEKKIPAFFQPGQGIHARFDNEMNEDLRLTLRHELTHYILHDTYQNLPAWMDEGLAEYMERKASIDPKPTFPEYNTLVVEDQQGTLLSLHELESSAYYSRSHGTISAGQAYVIGFIAVDELLKRTGMPAMRRFLQKISKDKSTETIFLQSFGLDYEKFNAELLQVAKKGAAA